MVIQRFRKQFWISFSVIIVSAIAAGVALNFLSGAITAQASAIARDRGAIQEKTDAVANLAMLESGAAQAAQYQTAIDQLFPSQYQVVTFTQWLSSLGQKYGVATNAAFQGASVPPSGSDPGSAQFSFSAQGTPQALSAFLDGMNERSSGFLVSLTSFDVTGSGGEETMTGQGMLFFK
ncbi:MAG TPA: hypothetical protein VMA75_01085 [Candidatus Paceibacterota bacterium]|nr:hypothetical protein [Candidatus Paceibacterota bacterium]